MAAIPELVTSKSDPWGSAAEFLEVESSNTDRSKSSDKRLERAQLRDQLIHERRVRIVRKFLIISLVLGALSQFVSFGREAEQVKSLSGEQALGLSRPKKLPVYEGEDYSSLKERLKALNGEAKLQKKTRQKMGRGGAKKKSDSWLSSVSNSFRSMFGIVSPERVLQKNDKKNSRAKKRKRDRGEVKEESGDGRYRLEEFSSDY